MTDTKGTIRARKLGNTGVTEDILKRIADAKGGHVLAICELKAEEIHEKVAGDDRRVDFVIDTIEPVVDGLLDGRVIDTVRDVQAALFRNRKLAEHGPTLPIDGESDEPTVEEVTAAQEALLERDEDGPVFWDGESEAGDSDAGDEGTDEPPSPDDPAYEPHEYSANSTGTGCAFPNCGQPADAAVHSFTTAEVDEPVNA